MKLTYYHGPQESFHLTMNWTKRRESKSQLKYLSPFGSRNAMCNVGSLQGVGLTNMGTWWPGFCMYFSAENQPLMSTHLTLTTNQSSRRWLLLDESGPFDITWPWPFYSQCAHPSISASESHAAINNLHHWHCMSFGPGEFGGWTRWLHNNRLKIILG